MLPETHPLIEAATSPLADNAEQRLAANVLLGEAFDPAHPEVADALERLERRNSRKHRASWKVVLWCLAGIALALAVFSLVPEIGLVKSLLRSSLFEPMERPPLPAGLSEGERLLLGDPALDEVEQGLLLHRHAPENPAYYAEYAGSYAARFETLPPDYFETIERIAPDNAFFVYFAAAQIGKKAIEKQHSGSGPRKQRVIDGVKLGPKFGESDFSIVDQAAFDEAMALIGKAAVLPDFQTYTSTMMAARSGILPDETIAGFMHSLVSVFSSAWGVIHLRNAADLMNAAAGDFSKNGKKEEFLVLARQRDAFMSQLAHNPDTNLVGELVFNVIGSTTAVNFHASADRLGLDEVAENYRSQKDGFQVWRDNREIRRKNGVAPFRAEHAAVIAGQTLSMVHSQASNPPPIHADDLKPMRLAEHDLASRLGVVAAALILLIACLPVYVFRYHSPRPARFPAQQLASLLRPADWAWVIILGIILPIVVYFGINRLTPLGGRDFNVEHFLFLFPGVHLLAILLNLLLAPAILLRWRLGKRLAPFGINCRPSLIPGAVLFLILLWSLAVYPIVREVDLSRNLLIALASVPALWLACVFLNVLLGFIGKPAGRIPRAATTSALLPAYAFGIIALCLTLPFFTASEKYWVSRDTIFKINPDAADLGAYEFKVAAQLRKEISENLKLPAN